MCLRNYLSNTSGCVEAVTVDFGFGPDGTVALRQRSRVAEERLTHITDVFVA
jgi:glycyl-tRNA synthetase (class II)